MQDRGKRTRKVRWLWIPLIILLALLASCTQAEPTPTPTATPLPPPTVAPPPTEAPPTATAVPPTATSVPPTATTAPPTARPIEEEAEEEESWIAPVVYEASAARIEVDGDTSDWTGIPWVEVPMEQIEPIPGEEFGPLDPITVRMRMAVDGERVYVLMEVPDDFDYDPGDHSLSPAMAVMFRIDEPAAPHMGVEEEDLERSFGKVDIWHWELDCGPGELSGGGLEGIRGGNDPDCNLDDEWATTPEEREDDGSREAENSLVGVWEHTGRDQGPGAPGTWIFEISRKLQTGDPDDAQMEMGGEVYVTLAYWDPDETPEGWTGAGHLQSSEYGWLEVKLPATP